MAGDVPVVAQRLDPTGGERQSAGGAAVLPVEDVRDHRVGVVDGEAADQVDGVLVGAQPVGWFAFDRHDSSVIAPPFQRSSSSACAVGVVAVHADVDFVEQAAQQVFAVLVGGGRRRPHGGEVVPERQDHRFLLWGQGFRSGRFAAGEFGLGVGERCSAVVPFGFQAAGDQAVVGVDRAVAAFGPAGLVAGLLDLSAPLRERGVVAVLEVLGGGQAGLQRGGLQRRQERLGDRGVDRLPADAQVAGAAALDQLAGAGAVVAGRGFGGAVVVDGEFAPAGAAGGQALQQRAALADRAGAGLVRGRAGVGAGYESGWPGRCPSR